MSITGSAFIPSITGGFSRLKPDIITGRAIDPGSIVELRIRISERDINVGQLYSFLRIIDRCYGRLLFGDLRTYAFQPALQLSATTFEPGSWEIVLTQIVSQLPNATPLLVLFAVILLLPKAAKNAASAYKTTQEGRLINEKRKALRERLKLARELSRLQPSYQKKLIQFTD